MTITGKHTSGPWTYEVHELSEGYSAIVYDEHGVMIADHPTEERARLIAAAPDLLKFAKAHNAYMLDSGYSGPDSDALHPKAAANWRMCRAVIAKAEGGAS